VLARTGEVKTSIIIALALATVLSGSLAAVAQTDEPVPIHQYLLHRLHGPHHTAHRRFVAHHRAPASAPESTVAAQRPDAVESPQPNQMFKPYAHPGDGDNDGMSLDPDDCMKGCIGGAPQ
jgi:hypothetical protein